MKNSTAIVLIIISVGLFYTWTMPQYTDVQTLMTEESQYQNILSNVTALSAKRDALLAKYQSMSPTDVDRMSKILPDTVDTVGLAQDLNSIAARYGISLKSVSASSNPNQQDSTNVVAPSSALYGTAVVSLDFVASYADFRKFMNDLEHNLRLTDTQALTFQITPTGNVYEYQVTMNTYWLK